MNKAEYRTIINIISGKGGTGKTLLACVLADMLGNTSDNTVLIVDLDVFVRGLTSLLYFHNGEKIKIADDNQLTVSSFFVGKLKDESSNHRPLAILKYRSFHVMPAVRNINEMLNFQDIAPNTRQEASEILSNLLNKIPNDYRFIILDSRAGYDELIAATHELSDISICIDEPDPISRITAENLISQLNQDSGGTQLFRLTNKAHGILSEEDLNKEEKISRGITYLGAIPFDMDVLQNFGSPRFWEEITRSLYRSALVQAWNKLSNKMEFDTPLAITRFRPVASERLEARIGILTTNQRVIAIYGALLSIIACVYGAQQFYNIYNTFSIGHGYNSPAYLFRDTVIAIGSIICGLIGVLGVVYSLRIKK